MTQSEAEAKPAEALVVSSGGRTVGKPKPMFPEFVEYLPFIEESGKDRRQVTTRGRLKFHLNSVYALRTVDRFSRDEL